MTQYNRDSAKARRARHQAALDRPELRFPSDGFMRAAPAGVTSAPIKTLDQATRTLIEQALQRRMVHQ